MSQTVSQKMQDFRNQLDRSLRDPSKPWTKHLDSAERATGINRVYLFAGFILAIAIFLSCGFFAGLICNTIGFVYPAYMSMKAIESPQKDDDLKWLTYWVVFASFSIVEYFSNFIVNLFPLYWLVKTIFVVWCFIPGDMNGAMIIYRRLIRPYFLQHHARIDEAASSGIIKGIIKIASAATEEVNEKIDKKLADGLHSD